MKKNTFLAIKKYLQVRNIADYRYDQILNAVFEQKITEFKQMIGLPKKLRLELENEFGQIMRLQKVREQTSDKAKKVLFELEDKKRIESVLMHYKSWDTLCISTQVGCKMNCDFCATAKIGFKRNLTVDEIVSQPLFFLLQDSQLHSLSLMGMGEPLDNPGTFSALRLLINKKMFNFGSRNINVSTIGIIPGLKKLSDQFPQINIALSLHTAIPQQRKELIPASAQYPLEQIMAVLDKHIRRTKRKVFLAYLMLKDVNDTHEHLKKLVALIKSRQDISYLYHLNLIRYNPVAAVETKYQASEQERLDYFKEKLEKNHIQFSVRKALGQHIEAGCGQLKAQY